TPSPPVCIRRATATATGSSRPSTTTCPMIASSRSKLPPTCCHDHKFDPISQKDYYGLAGIVASTDYVEAPLVPLEVVEEAKKKQTPEEKKKKVPPNYPFAHAIKETKAVTLKVHLRGNPQTLGDEAPHRFLEVLAP